jgi:hypothetical protein
MKRGTDFPNMERSSDAAQQGASELNTMLERLAELEHEQWWKWAENMMANEPGISAERIARWKGSMVPYSQLTEENKEHDRIWARRVLEILSSNAMLSGTETEPTTKCGA